MSTETSVLFSHKVIVLSNALVNARFSLGTVEMRLLLAMLARIEREDTEFREMHIPLQELVGLSGRRLSIKDYQQLKTMSERLARRVVKAWPLHAKPADSLREEDFDLVTLLAYARYSAGEGVLRVRFNNEVRPYLLQLNQNFTQARLTQLLKLKSANSCRIYLLIKQLADFGKRLIELTELKRMLGLEGKYKQLSLFRLRVLDPVQQELSTTDLPFNYELVMERPGVTMVRFIMQVQAAITPGFEQVAGAIKPPFPVDDAIVASEQALRELGVANRTIARLTDQMQQGRLAAAYVQFVIRKQKAGQAAGKIKNLAGAIVHAISQRQFLEEFEVPQVQRQRSLSTAVKDQKVQGLLEDARRSLAFILSKYEGEELRRYEAQARVDIARYEAQLLGR